MSDRYVSYEKFTNEQLVNVIANFKTAMINNEKDNKFFSNQEMQAKIETAISILKNRHYYDA